MAWDESKHPRGQPENSGEFGPGGRQTAAQQQPKQPAQQSHPSAAPAPQQPGASTTEQADHVAAASIKTSPLNAQELQAIDAYRKTDQVYKINNFLRGTGGIISKAKNAVFGVGNAAKTTVAHLDAAIAKSTITQSLTVLRGFRLEMSNDPSKIFKPGSTFEDQGFVSTTLAGEVAEKFSTSFTAHRIIMEIAVPQGSNGYHMPRKEGEYDEAEVVLPRGAKFQVQSVEKDKNNVYRVKVGYAGSQSVALSQAISLSQAVSQPTMDRNGRFLWSLGDIRWHPQQGKVQLSQYLTEPTEHAKAADALAAAVIRRAEGAGVAISTEVRREALAMMKRLTKANLPPTRLLSDFLRAFRAILRKYEPILARTLSDAKLAAWLQGGQGVLDVLPPMEGKSPDWASSIEVRGDVEPIVRFPIIEAAAKDLAARQILRAPDLFLENQAAQETGFYRARKAALDALEKIRDALTEAVIDGDSLPMFREKVADALDVSGLSPHKQEMMFRDVVMGSYARGQKAVVESPLVRSVAVFAWRTEINDSRLTPLCRALSNSGLVGANGKRSSFFCVDDPVWAIVAPQSHTGCRCGTIFLTIKRAAQKGILVAKNWLATGIRPPDEELFVPMPDLSGVPAAERKRFESWASPWQQASIALSSGYDPNEPRDGKGKWATGGSKTIKKTTGGAVVVHKSLSVDDAAAKKFAETGTATAFRIHNAKTPLPKESANMWTDADEDAMPGVSGYANLSNALEDMLLNERESVTGENYTQAIHDASGHPSIVVMDGPYKDGPGAEVIVPNPKIAAVFTQDQVESAFRDAAKTLLAELGGTNLGRLSSMSPNEIVSEFEFDRRDKIRVIGDVEESLKKLASQRA